MQHSVAQQIHKAAEDLLQAVSTPGADISECLNSTLNQFLIWPFRSGTTYINDSDGQNVRFDSVIYAASDRDSEELPANVNADTVACAISTFGSLGQEELQSGYQRIAAFKRLKRTPAPKLKYPVNFSPLGIIFAVDSDISMEGIADLMIPLNENHPFVEWPDMVVVLTKGTVNYGASFLGEPIKGDFLLPNSTNFPVHALYLHVIARGLGLLSANKMCALIFMHLMTFTPGTKLPNADMVMEGILPMGLTMGTYQFNLKRQLVPARNKLWEQGAIGPLPFRIEDVNGNLLSRLQFIPWQDGAVIRLTGKLPLEGILVFLGTDAPNAQIIRQSEGAISSVLPINEGHFRKLLSRIQLQTNMKVKPERPKWTISKYADEGTTSPFMNRLFLTIVRLREVAFNDPTTRREFDKHYQFVFETLTDARTLSDEILQTLTEHKKKVIQGEISSLRGSVIHISENIGRKLHKQVDGFLNAAVRVIKDGMQDLSSFYNINIGFLFNKESTFEKEIDSLKNSRPELAAYLRETRKWSEVLILRRNALHKGWMLPRMTYQESSPGAIRNIEPEISSQPLSTFVNFMLDRLCCFVEEFTVFGLQSKMPSGISITEIPISDRKTEEPRRFEATFVNGGRPIWTIEYHDSSILDT